jgi:glycosyltransferase involved in cell wall biosynthesis
MNADGSIDVRFWGNIPPGDMPAMLNCVDVLLLPSLNEGLGMICAEAVRCGAVVIGSDVGGIPEVVGKDYVVPLGDGFVEGMASKAVAMLQTPSAQVLPFELDWNSTAAKELSVIRSVL